MLSVRPKLWRLLLGFFLAPLAAVIFARIVSLAAQDIPQGMLPSLQIILLDIPSFAVFGGYPIGWGIGIPAYLLLRGRLLPVLRNFMFAGALVAATPLLLTVLFYTRSIAFNSVGSAIESLTFLAFCALSGAAGGAVLWLCTVWRDPRFRDQAALVSSS
jgi:hypothetical protein